MSMIKALLKQMMSKTETIVTAASLPWLRLDGHATTVLARRPRLGGHGLAGTA
jgi:hypothetical protein